jgi:hypothetical protein
MYRLQSSLRLFRQVAEHTGCGAARGVGVSFLTNSQLVLLRALTRTISNIGVLGPLFTNNFFFSFLASYPSILTSFLHIGILT